MGLCFFFNTLMLRDYGCTWTLGDWSLPEMVQYFCPRTAFHCTPHEHDQDMCERTVFIIFQFLCSESHVYSCSNVVPIIAVVDSIQWSIFHLNSPNKHVIFIRKKSCTPVPGGGFGFTNVHVFVFLMCVWNVLYSRKMSTLTWANTDILSFTEVHGVRNPLVVGSKGLK